MACELTPEQAAENRKIGICFETDDYSNLHNPWLFYIGIPRRASLFVRFFSLFVYFSIAEACNGCFVHCFPSLGSFPGSRISKVKHTCKISFQNFVFHSDFCHVFQTRTSKWTCFCKIVAPKHWFLQSFTALISKNLSEDRYFLFFLTFRPFPVAGPCNGCFLHFSPPWGLPTGCFFHFSPPWELPSLRNFRTQTYMQDILPKNCFSQCCYHVFRCPPRGVFPR